MLAFIKTHFGEASILSIKPLAKAGSDRQYVRVQTTNATSYIVCENKNVKENESFIYFSTFFSQKGIPVPTIIAVNSDKTIYIQTDLGNESLLDAVLQYGHTATVKSYYKKVLTALASMQIHASQGIDYNQCFAAKQFDSQSVLADLNYFKYYFLDLQTITYNKALLQKEFEALSQEVASIEPQYFMFRDFQGRNIMLHHGEPFFIDYQGAMQGPILYDVASLLWQAKAQLPVAWKQELLLHYIAEMQKQLATIAASGNFITSSNAKTINEDYSKIALVRLLQVLGAYGFRGIIEQRIHFLTSIPQGLQNIKEWISQFSIEKYPTITSILHELAKETLLQKYVIPQANENTPLKVLVQSFSYKVGIPSDTSGNGGGFVFDCRGLLNPGRFEEYKKLTGRDQPVIDFLESKTKIQEFISNAKQLVSISVDDYLARGFSHLMISFGCTGGQHRSVYSADAMAKFLEEKYKLEVQVVHINQEAKGWIN